MRPAFAAVCVPLLAATLLGASCRRSNTEPASPSSAPPAPVEHAQTVDARARASAPVPALPPTRVSAVARLVAVGDLHGDHDAARAAFRLAGVLDAQDHWSGGSTVIVQTGDQLDRGTQERALLEWLERMEGEAGRAGGAVYVLNGNHEIMNAEGDFRYVPPAGFADFASLGGAGDAQRTRREIFAPGGAYARKFAAHNTVMIVGDTAFVHGGLLPMHLDYGLDAINRDVRAFLLGEQRLPAILSGEDSPVWHRDFALRDDAGTCSLLRATLEKAHVARLVIGHTVQPRGMNSACDGAVWRIDVGLSRVYETASVQVLELKPNEPPHILTAAR